MGTPRTRCDPKHLKGHVPGPAATTTAALVQPGLCQLRVTLQTCLTVSVSAVFFMLLYFTVQQSSIFFIWIPVCSDIFFLYYICLVIILYYLSFLCSFSSHLNFSVILFLQKDLRFSFVYILLTPPSLFFFFFFFFFSSLELKMNYCKSFLSVLHFFVIAFLLQNILLPHLLIRW